MKGFEAITFSANHLPLLNKKSKEHVAELLKACDSESLKQFDLKTIYAFLEVAYKL